jgi:hypothetical protein
MFLIKVVLLFVSVHRLIICVFLIMRAFISFYSMTGASLVFTNNKPEAIPFATL